MASRSVMGLFESPTVLCVGTSAAQFAALAEASDGRLVMVYLPDAESAHRLLTREDISAVDITVPTMRQPIEPSTHRVECGELRLDADLREATWRGIVLRLSARAFDLLFALMRDPGRVWSFAELTAQVWNRPYLGDTDAVVSAVKRLRRQIRSVTSAVVVESVRGVGYRLVDNEQNLVS
jgi:two-component system, OmpR family, response regulator MtrA